MGVNRGERLVDLGTRADVHGECNGCMSGIGQALGDRRESLGIAIEKGETCALGGEEFGGPFADSGGGAGDDCDFVSEQHNRF